MVKKRVKKVSKKIVSKKTKPKKKTVPKKAKKSVKAKAKPRTKPKPKVAKKKPKPAKKVSSVHRKLEDSHHFHVSDGSRIANLFELAKVMETMPDEVFRHHVNDDKHDFANWVRDIYKEPAFAKNLEEASHRHAVQMETLKFLVEKLK